MSRYLKIFICVSLLSNLLLAGILIGHVGYRVIEPKRLTVQDVALALSAGKRDELKGSITQADKTLSALRQQLADARKKAAVILKTEPFNKDAYAAQVHEIQGIKGLVAEFMTKEVIGLAGQSTPQERAAMADILFP
jgi:uncharacterized membrane protein